MADIQFLKGTATVTNGSRTINITGANGAFVSIGTAVFINGNPPVEGVEGTGTTIELRDPWPYATVTGEPFVAFNTLEGLANAIRRLRDTTTDSLGISNAFSDIITSTDPTIQIELSTGPVTVTPFGYLEQEGNALIAELQQAADLFTQLESDVADLTQDVADQQSIVDANLTASVDAKDAAEAAATNAEASATAASTSETNAANSALAASASETNAANSASAAATSESNAGDSAAAAATSATNAANSATAAATSETNAATSESNAATSETNSAASAAAALASEQAAALSASDADSAAILAESYANYVGLWSGLTGALNIPASVFHNDTFWQLLVNIPDVTASEPSAVNTDWKAIGATVTSVNGKTGTVNLVIADIPTLQSSLDAKADAGSLAAVATSGSYSDLSGTPDLSDLDNATNTATANTLVKRDGSGNFQVNTPTADSHPATKLFVEQTIGSDVSALNERLDEIEILALAGL